MIALTVVDLHDREWGEFQRLALAIFRSAAIDWRSEAPLLYDRSASVKSHMSRAEILARSRVAWIERRIQAGMFLGYREDDIARCWFSIVQIDRATFQAKWRQAIDPVSHRTNDEEMQWLRDQSILTRGLVVRAQARSERQHPRRRVRRQALMMGGCV